MHLVLTRPVRREVCTNAGSPNTEQRTLSGVSDALSETLTVLLADPNNHWTLKQQTSYVRCWVSGALCSLEPNTTVHWTLRPAFGASVHCVRWNTPMTSQRVWRDRKYLFHFLKSVESFLTSSAGGREEPKPLSTLETPPPLQMC